MIMKRIAMMLLLLAIAPPVWAGDVITLLASGEVIATDNHAEPRTIVIKTKNRKGLDFIVGADVEGGTVITIGKNKASLKDIKIGDKADIVYERNMKVVAKSIKIKR